MTTTRRSVLYIKAGENSTTPATPMAAWREQVDLSTTAVYCLSAEDDQLVSRPKYEVHEIELPSWMTTNEYCLNYISWKYLWGCGADPEWPEEWQRLLINGRTAEKLALIQLLKTKKFRSEFRMGLRDQLVTWLNDTERRYASPFSPKQWDTLLNKYLLRDAVQLGEKLYRDRQYLGVPKSPEKKTKPLATRRRRPLENRIADAEAWAASSLAKANAAREGGRDDTYWMERAQLWLDRANVLRGQGSV